jgi:uncharacterized protein (TIGR02145 family)
VKNNKLILLFLFSYLLILSVCKKVEEVMMVLTGEVTNIQQNSAEVSGLIVDLGNGATEYGHCYGKTPNVSLNSLKTALGTPAGNGGFTSMLSDLEVGTKYYINAYLSNGKEVVYGKEINFSTSAALLPEITTKAVTDITQQGANSGGNVSSDGGAPVTALGVCWNTLSGPTISNNKTTDGNGTGTYSSNMTGLSLSTTYYVRAYATNSTGTAYGNEVYFTTAAGAVIPPVTTTDVTAITKNSAVSGGTITNDGGAAVTDRGVCWSITINPTIASFKTSDGTGIGNFSSNLTGLNSATTYYVRAFATNNVGTGYGNQLTFTTSADVPSISTSAISSVAGTTASCGGNITSDGGALVTARGVCWNTLPNPTTANSKTTDGSGIGSFVSYISGLTYNTTYYVRAYATNSAGTGYGNDGSFTTSDQTTVTDYDGNVYNIVTIGTQVWMAENLKTTKYNDGTDIPLVTDNTVWSTLITPGYCLYNNDATTYKATYGALYNWYAVSTVKLCPSGYHVPSDVEWTTMENYLIANGYNYDGTTTGNKIAKALAAATSWTPSSITGAVGNTDYPAKRNATGFTALPGGYRYNGGTFADVGRDCDWWSATEFGATSAWHRGMSYASSNVFRNIYYKEYGFSVRCLKD